MFDQYNKLHAATGSVVESKQDWKVTCINPDCGHHMSYLGSAIRHINGEPAGWKCEECGQTTDTTDSPKIDMKEVTTSADIAFAPQMGFRDPTQKELKQIGFPKYRKNRPVKEAEESVKALKNQIIKALKDLVGKSKLHVSDFTVAFPRYNDATPATVLLDLLSIADGLGRLYNKLPNDLGELELIKNSLLDHRPLNVYEAFRGINHLYGCRLASSQEGVRLVYECGLNLAYLESETLLVNDIDIIGEIRTQIKSVRIADRLLFPVGGLFEPSVFNKVKSIIATGVEPVKAETGGKK